MKQVRGYEVQEFTYETKEERENHVNEMDNDGWSVSSQIRRLKDDVNLMTATDKDYEYYAYFQKDLI